MSEDYPKWMKPHLRERLERAKREAGGQSPSPPSPFPCPTAAQRATVAVGALVRLRKPADPDEGVGWENDMDQYDGMVLTVDHVDHRDNTFQTVESGLYWFETSWAWVP